MRFHNRKLFNSAYEPRPFCYAIRRPDHYPEGVLSIESDNNDGTPADPLYTVVRHGVATRPMRFALNAATNVSFFGDHFVHAFVGHKFSGQASPSLNLVARARQFSSFILLVGRIASAEVSGISCWVGYVVFVMLFAGGCVCCSLRSFRLRHLFDIACVITLLTGLRAQVRHDHSKQR
jgi:hypothetical protein